MAGWWLVTPLVLLRDEVNAAHPGRDKRSDGSIGDRAHQLRTSQHNQDPDGSVDAVDIDVSGINKARFKAVVLADPRTRLLIADRQIWKRGADGVMRAYAYRGENPHVEHYHVEVETRFERDTRSWGYKAGVVVATPAVNSAGGLTKLPVLRRNTRVWKAANVQLQKALIRLGYNVGASGADGKFGDNTARAVIAFQRKYGLKADAVVGTVTWIALAQALVEHVGGIELGTIDGVFGGKTGAAVERFQKARGLKADRIVGPKTWAALLS